MIVTERLLLRAWRAEDAVPFHLLGRDEEVMRHIGPLLSRAEAEAMVARQQGILAATGRCFWAIERQTDGAFLGFCGVKPGPEGTPIAGLVEIGWRLRRDAWGQGHAREAAAACLDAEWMRGTDQVVAITTRANTRSWGLMQRLGMVRDVSADFNHPAVPQGDPLRPHITYRIARPA